MQSAASRSEAKGGTPNQNHEQGSKGFPCRFTNCQQSFSTASHLKRHWNRFHEDKSYHCPSTGCSKTYTSAHGLKYHQLTVHLGVRAKCPCPMKGCTKTFSSNSVALRHCRTQHEGSRLPCPLSLTDGCKSVFTSSQSVNDHIRAIHHKERLPCPFRESSGCTTTFSQAPAVRNHVRRLHSPRWLCPLPACRSSVSGHGVSNGQIGVHMAKHRELGHLLNDLLRPVQILSPQKEFEDSQSELQRWLSSLFEGDPNYDENEEYSDEDFDDDTPDLEIEQRGPYESKFLPACLDLVLKDQFAIEPVNFSLQSQDVLNRNLDIVRKFPHKSQYSNYGLRCIGPGNVAEGLVSERCAANVIISFRTARLVMRPSEMSIRYPNGHPLLLNRCITCESKYETSRYFCNHGLQKKDGQTVCDYCGCLKPIWSTAKYCWAHLRSPIDNRENSTLGKAMQKAMSHIWRPNKDVQQGLSIYEKVLTGDLPLGRLMFLDLEYDATTRRVYEVGICDVWGNKVIDCFTSLSNAEMNRTTRTAQSSYPTKFNLLARKAAKARGHYHGTLNVHQLVKRLQQSGVSSKTIFIVWATNKLDLSSLREWFEAAGYSILPPDVQCVSMVQPFRSNLGKLPDGTSFPLALSILFPLIFGTRHELAGRNHHALVDAQQTRLMFQEFRSMCQERSVYPGNRTGKDRNGVSQASIDAFFSSGR